MNTLRGTKTLSRVSRQAASGRLSLRFTDLLLPCSLGLWAAGVSMTHTTAIGPYGLPAALPVVFWAALALLVLSAAIELGRDHPSGWRMCMHATALPVMLYGTAPLVYSQGRYSWLYKTAGVVQYVSAHGRLDKHIDVYQNWPGFFALAAWFGKVAGVASPLAYAKWAQLVFELAALPLLYLAFAALTLTVQQRWLALLLYSGSNWIGQDYFSPQALGTLLSLGVMAIALRWLYGSRSSVYSRPDQVLGAAQEDLGLRRHTSLHAGYDVPLCTVLVFIYFVLTFTHELSPYILAVQLGALAIARLLRPRWLPLVLLAIAVGFLLPRFGYVNSHYGLLSSIGDFFSNAAPPAFKSGSLSAAQHLIEHSQEALSVGMWCLAVAGAWLRRRSGHPVLAAVLLAFSPFVMLGLLAYGGEGILRVYLFSLPWTAALAALALVPFPAVVGEVKALGSPKPAEALATSLGIPESGSSDLEDTLIFSREDVDSLMQAADLARQDAREATDQAGSGQAGTSRVPPPAGRMPAAEPSGRNLATVSPQRARRNLRIPRRLKLTRHGWHLVIWMVLAAVVIGASILAAALISNPEASGDTGKAGGPSVSGIVALRSEAVFVWPRTLPHARVEVRSS